MNKQYYQLSEENMKRVEHTIQALLDMQIHPEAYPTDPREQHAMALTLGGVPQDIATDILSLVGLQRQAV